MCRNKSKELILIYLPVIKSYFCNVNENHRQLYLVAFVHNLIYTISFAFVLFDSISIILNHSRMLDSWIF